MEIANALARVVETRSLTVTQFAAMSGVTESMARRWVKGEAQPAASRFIHLVGIFPELRQLFEIEKPRRVLKSKRASAA